MDCMQWTIETEIEAAIVNEYYLIIRVIWMNLAYVLIRRFGLEELFHMRLLTFLFLVWKLG